MFLFSGVGKSIIFFEGEFDYRILVYDSVLRLIGFFKVVGRIIGYFVLYGGFGLIEFFLAIKYYLLYVLDN